VESTNRPKRAHVHTRTRYTLRAIRHPKRLTDEGNWSTIGILMFAAKTQGKRWPASARYRQHYMLTVWW